MESVQFIQTSPHHLAELIDAKIKVALLKLEDKLLSKDANDELLTRKQACELLQIEQTTLYHWTCKGKIQAYGIGNRRYYKRSELLGSLKALKMK